MTTCCRISWAGGGVFASIGATERFRRPSSVAPVFHPQLPRHPAFPAREVAATGRFGNRRAGQDVCRISSGEHAPDDARVWQRAEGPDLQGHEPAGDDVGERRRESDRSGYPAAAQQEAVSAGRILLKSAV